MRKRGKRHPGLVLTNPLLAMQPAPERERASLMRRFHSALAAMRTDAAPTPEHWRLLSDVVNVMETLLLQGKVLESEVGPIVNNAVTALAIAGQRHRAGHRLGLDGPGLQAMTAVLGAYEDCLEGFTGLEMAHARHATEKRMQQVLRGKTPTGVEVIAV